MSCIYTVVEVPDVTGLESRRALFVGERLDPVLCQLLSVRASVEVEDLRDALGILFMRPERPTRPAFRVRPSLPRTPRLVEPGAVGRRPPTPMSS